MATLTFAATLQDERRLPYGLAFGGTLDEVIRCIPFISLKGLRESLRDSAGRT